MININGRKFAKNQSEFINTLFEDGYTACGTYKVRKNDILFFDHQGTPRYFLNAYGVFGSVMVLDSGKKWYSYLSISDEEFLGFCDSYSKKVSIAESILRHVGIQIRREA